MTILKKNLLIVACCAAMCQIIHAASMTNLLREMGDLPSSKNLSVVATVPQKNTIQPTVVMLPPTFDALQNNEWYQKAMQILQDPSLFSLYNSSVFWIQQFLLQYATHELHFLSQQSLVAVQHRSLASLLQTMTIANQTSQAPVVTGLAAVMDMMPQQTVAQQNVSNSLSTVLQSMRTVVAAPPVKSASADITFLLDALRVSPPKQVSSLYPVVPKG